MKRPPVSDDQRRFRLATRHRLLPQTWTDDVVRIAVDLVALHSSDPVALHLSCAVRMATPDIAVTERALYEERTLVRHHAMRRTLWVTTPAAARLMHAACTVKIAGTERARVLALLADNGIENPGDWLEHAKERVLEVIRRHGGPIATREVGPLVPELTVSVLSRGPNPITLRAHTQVLSLLGFEGELIRTRPTGTWVSGAYAWMPMEQWLPGGLRGTPEEQARTALVENYLRRFGPVTTADVQWWGGWTKKQTMAALAGAHAVEVETEQGPGWVAAEDADDVPDPGPWVALLPGLDPTAMGWKQRDFYLPPESMPVWDRNGNCGPSVWVDGRLVGAWAQGPDGDIRTRLFVDVGAERSAMVAERAAAMAVLLPHRVSVRFPGPVHQELSEQVSR